jgi:hypothetical protein
MRFSSLASALVVAILAAAVRASPVAKRRVPNSDAPLAQLHGLPACYVSEMAQLMGAVLTVQQAKCMISEAHYGTYDMWTQTVDHWCHEYYGSIGLTRWWMNYHFYPCVRANCEPTNFNRDSESYFSSQSRVAVADHRPPFSFQRLPSGGNRSATSKNLLTMGPANSEDPSGSDGAKSGCERPWI